MVMVAERQPGKLNSSSLPILQLPEMAATESLVKKKLKIKIGSKGVRIESEKESGEYGADVLVHNEFTRDTSLNENKKLNMNIKVKLPVQGHSKKRGAHMVLDAQIEKRQKMDRGMRQQCGGILKDLTKQKMDRGIRQQCGGILEELMTHKYGWPFNQPVDPVKYKIPDYFTVISKPMDLGTVRSKLENNEYLYPDEFAADVQLTFSNCMLYNPPYNDFHCMAKELNNVFNRKWKLLESKLKRESKNVKQVCISNGNGEGAQGILQTCFRKSPSTCCRKSPSYVSSIKRRTMSLEEKQNLRDELKEMLRGKMTEKLQSTLRKYKLCSLKERIDVDINALDDEILWELKRMLKSSLNLAAAKVEPAKMTESSRCPLPSGVADKGTDSGSGISCGSANAKAPASIVDSRCGSCDHLTCQCALQNSEGQASSSDMSSGKALQNGVSRTECQVKNSTVVHMNRSDLDSNGAGSFVEDNVCLSPGFSVCGSTTVSDGGWTPLVDVHLSPKKALRAAMLKSRFADTIFKAKQKTLLDQGDKADLVKSQEEKVRLEKQQREEKARIEAQIIAAEAASRRRAEADLKMQREREREAARIALQQMEKTVEIDDNLKFFKDLEMLSQSSTLDYPLGGLEVVIDAAGCGHVGNPLELLGLHIKEDFAEEDEEEAILNGDREEGEILA